MADQRQEASDPAPPHGEPVTLAQLGGDAGIARWVERFYARVAQEPLLAPMFDDLARAQEKQYAYFVEFFGGPKLYTEQYGRAFLRFKHRHFRIGQPEREAWMRHAMEALAEDVDDPAILSAVEQRLAPLAQAMVNHNPEQHDAYFFQR